jgi:RNA polymerase sigma factor (sigma-70 family)
MPDTAPAAVNAADHVNLARSVARRFRGAAAARGIDFQEIEAEALLALTKVCAARAFRPELGCAVSTFLTACITNALRHSLQARRHRPLPQLPAVVEEGAVRQLDPSDPRPDADAAAVAMEREEERHGRDLLARLLARLLGRLPARERRAIALSFGLLDGMERAGPQLAQDLGVCRAWANQLTQRAMRLLRQAAGTSA